MLIEIGQYAAALSAVLVLGGMLIKWLVVTPIKLYIEKMTYPIQPHANGGKSLADVAQAVNRIELAVSDVDTRLLAVENLVTKPTTRKKSNS